MKYLRETMFKYLYTNQRNDLNEERQTEDKKKRKKILGQTLNSKILASYCI